MPAGFFHPPFGAKLLSAGLDPVPLRRLCAGVYSPSAPTGHVVHWPGTLGCSVASPPGFWKGASRYSSWWEISKTSMERQTIATTATMTRRRSSRRASRWWLT